MPQVVVNRSFPRYTLGPERVALFGDIPLRLNEDLRKCVACVGYVTTDLTGEQVFEPGGTGFFVKHGGVCYFVTARHVAEELGPPFAMRATNDKGEPVMLGEIVRAGWFYHPDETVDLAIVLGIPKGVPPLSSTTILTKEKAAALSIGIGDEAHIVGLYRLLRGKTKNVPIVHTGHIALVPGEERVPQRDRNRGRTIDVDVYLVEAQTLEGLSGSPVFVRESRSAYINGHVGGNSATQYALLSGEAHFLGIWSGAWDAPPGEVLAIDRPEAMRVPVGMGLTVPGWRLLELLDDPAVAEERARALAEINAANQDSALKKKPPAEPATTDANPRHKEDFTALLNAAARKKRSAE